jgi:imidazolonepropionase-like amidohydrolase
LRARHHKSIAVRTLAVAALAAALLPLAALPAAQPAGGDERVAIKAGRLLDVRTGKYRSQVYIVVDHGRIAALSDTAPEGTRVVDLSSKIVLPGIVDVHAHPGTDYKDISSGSYARTSGPQAALIGVVNLRTYLDLGVTTLRDAGEVNFDYPQFALRDAVRKGLIAGPRMLCAGGLISVTGGHGDSDASDPEFAVAKRFNIADTVEEMRVAVRRDLKYGADWIKLMASGGIADVLSDFHVQELSEEQMAAAVELAHRAGRRVMAHAEGTAGIRAAVRAGVDSIEHGTMLDEETAAAMESKGTWLVPTLYTFQRGLELGLADGIEPQMLAKNKEIMQYQQPAFALALKHHLNIAFGDDGEPEVATHEFGALVHGGMSALQALQAATINGARLLGLDSEIGAVEVGKSADIIAVDSDPLTDITAMYQVSFVMAAGRITKQL